MPGLRDLLKKKDQISKHARQQQQHQDVTPPEPEFKFIRSTTTTEEVIHPSSFNDGNYTNSTDANPPITSPKTPRRSAEHHRAVAFRRSSNAALTKDPTAQPDPEPPSPSPGRSSEKRLSQRFGLARARRSLSRSSSIEPSDILPADLPDAPPAVAGHAAHDAEERDAREAQWEQRAALLAQSVPLGGGGSSETAPRTPSRPGSAAAASRSVSPQPQPQSPPPPPRSRSRSSTISSARGDDDIQEAIRLHELGELGLSTAMFGRLAAPADQGGRDNALAQVLFGLALRHGWGVEVDAERAVRSLARAAANAAAVEREALDAGLARGGAAKGELVLAVFELANCLRHGWGVPVDRVAARTYYETAANLGDVDAMEEAAWCYVEGFGTPKDKFRAAQYLRLAEEKGRRQVGNSWIWKEKYNPK